MHIRILSPAGNIKQRLVETGAATIRNWGHKVSVSEHALGSYGRFSGMPEERAQDIIEALKDPDVDIIWATRGGYGCMHIIDLIPIDLIKKADKPIIGYSDITALHALWSKAEVKSLHAPMMKHLTDDPGHRSTKTLRELLDYYSAHHSWPKHHNRLFTAKAKLYIAPGQGLNAESNSHSEAFEFESNTTFVGGNLSVLSSLHGTPYDYDYSGKIIFIEDIAEQPYKLDRMLQHLRLMGVFGQRMEDGSIDHSKSAAGIVCGHFTDCPDDPSMPAKIWDNIRWILQAYDIPLWLGAPFGHEIDNYPVVVG